MSLIKKIKVVMYVVLSTMVSISHAIDRPPVPNITGVTFDGKKIIINGTVAFGYDSIHVVLLSDFTASLGYVNDFGNDKGEGPAINYASKSFPISFNPSMQSRERYFVAAATSKINADDNVRVFSGWKVYIDTTTGMPLTISTSSGENGENLFYRARRINETNNKEVVYDLTFSLPKSRASECKLILKHNGIPKLNINDLSTVSNTKTDILNAIQDTVGEGSGNLCIKSEASGFYLYRFFGVLNANPNDSISATLIDTAGLVMDTLKSPIGISEDIGQMNIISTIYALTAMPSGTTDPLNPDSITTRSDSTMLKLLITAMADLSLAHNSPQPDPNEQSQGIFTNYMQFMDNVVGKWDSIGNTSAGIKRLERINDIILKANRNNIIDPVYIKNHGTLTEYGLPVQKQQRKNYAFYEGYTRMHVDMDLWPDSNMHEKTGIGVMFRVSDNIELYEADLADTFNMFKKPFLSGDSLNRRIIYKADGTILSKLDKDGLWVKGKDENNPLKQYYLGISSVRLSIKSLLNAKPFDTAFIIADESACKGDLEGTIVGGAGKSVVKMYEITLCKDGKADTIVNPFSPEILMHGQRRNIIIDSNYTKDADSIKFNIIAHDTTDRGKFLLVEERRFSAILNDTAKTNGKNDIVASVWYKGKLSLILLKQHCYSKKLWFRDIENGVSKPHITIPYYEAYFEKESNLFPVEFYKGGKYKIKWSDGLKLHKNEEMGNKDLALSNELYEKIPFGCNLNYNDLFTQVKPIGKFIIEMRYCPNTEWIQFEWINLLNETVNKSEFIIINIEELIKKDFFNISEKIEEQCVCKNGIEYNECIDEAKKITAQYIKMYSFISNNPSSFGLLDVNNIGIPIDAQNFEDYHSGWLCFQWAFFTQYYLNQLSYKHFIIEWSAVMSLTEEGNPGFAHNWISVHVPGCTITDTIHLDPWLQYRAAAFTTKEHEELFGTRSYIGKTNLNMTSYDGKIYGYFDDDNYYEIYPPKTIKGDYWYRWPKWVIEKYSANKGNR